MRQNISRQILKPILGNVILGKAYIFPRHFMGKSLLNSLLFIKGVYQLD